VGTVGSFSGDKAAQAWSWPLTSIYYRSWKYVELYLCSPKWINDMELNWGQEQIYLWHYYRPGFDPRPGHVGFVVDKVALERVLSEYSGFPSQFSFHRLLRIHNQPIISPYIVSIQRASLNNQPKKASSWIM
jgi:hypothetical protein